MPTLRVDDEVYEGLGKLAIPFVDKTPNDVLRRLLNLGGEHAASAILSAKEEMKVAISASKRKRPRIPDATPKQVYRRPILEELVKAGGQSTVSTVLDALEERIPFLRSDYLKIKTGETRWRNRAKWARKDLQEEGLIEPSTGRGLWVISEEGRKALVSGNV
ncbi:MAG TPA: winged helix-turn-helix domain-containing protein [Dehalococcoidia bacterium]|nr:winged helix-turn-helix domain-containing protein [Dehalococcoidia bacterium]